MADWLIAFSDKKKKLAGGEDTAPAGRREGVCQREPALKTAFYV